MALSARWALKRPSRVPFWTASRGASGCHAVQLQSTGGTWPDRSPVAVELHGLLLRGAHGGLEATGPGLYSSGVSLARPAPESRRSVLRSAFRQTAFYPPPFQAASRPAGHRRGNHRAFARCRIWGQGKDGGPVGCRRQRRPSHVSRALRSMLVKCEWKIEFQYAAGRFLEGGSRHHRHPSAQLEAEVVSWFIVSFPAPVASSLSSVWSTRSWPAKQCGGE